MPTVPNCLTPPLRRWLSKPETLAEDESVGLPLISQQESCMRLFSPPGVARPHLDVRCSLATPREVTFTLRNLDPLFGPNRPKHTSSAIFVGLLFDRTHHPC